MNVGSISGGGQTVKASYKQRDAVLTRLQEQIKDLQKEIKNIGKMSTLSPEQKQEKQKVLREQVESLQQQYADRQRQLQEQAAEAQASNRGEKSEKTAEKDPEAARMQALLEQSSSLQHAMKFDEVRISTEGRLRILDRQLESDGGDALASSQLDRDQLDVTVQSVRDSQADAIEDVNGKVAEEAEKAGDNKDVSESEQEKETEEAKASEEAEADGEPGKSSKSIQPE